MRRLLRSCSRSSNATSTQSPAWITTSAPLTAAHTSPGRSRARLGTCVSARITSRIGGVFPPGRRTTSARSESGADLFDAQARDDEVGDATKLATVDTAHSDGDPANRLVVIEMHAVGNLGDGLAAGAAAPRRRIGPSLRGVQQRTGAAT